MDYGTIVATCIETTGRYDKEAYISARVNAVCRKIASLQDSFHDLSETVEVVDGTATVLNLALPSDFRKVAYLRPLPYAKFLDPMTPNQGIMNGKELTNSYYISGSTIIIRLRNGYQTSSLARGYYLYPTTLVLPTDTNWVTDTYGDLIVDMICAMVYRATGDVKTAMALEGGSVGIQASLDQIASNDRTGGKANIIGMNHKGMR